MSAQDSAPKSPGLIPRLISWALQRTLVRSFLLYSEHRGAQLADSITYRTLFSLFAGVLLGFSVVFTVIAARRFRVEEAKLSWA